MQKAPPELNTKLATMLEDFMFQLKPNFQ